MWIIPKNIQQQCSQFAQATVESNLDSNDLAFLFAQSLTWRGKDSPSQTWLRRWKRVKWLRLLSSRMLNHSLTKVFVDEWTCSLPVIRASHSVQPVTAKEKKTHVTCGRTSQGEFDFADPAGSSAKTSKDTFLSGCATSCPTWSSWVTDRRGDYLARLKLAHHTNGSACLFWPTATARDGKGMSGKGRQERKNNPADTLCNAVAVWPTPTTAEGIKVASRPNYGQLGLSNHPAIVGLPDREKLNKSGRSLGQWATPNTGPRGSQPESKRKAEGRTINLEDQLHTQQGKLNPNWVEQLMGLPVEWTQLPADWTD